MTYLLSAIATLAVLASFPAGANADFELGSADPAYVTAGSEAERTELFDETSGLGATIVRFNAIWLRIAQSQPTTATDPADPAYDWTDLDAAARAAAARGFEPVITIQKAPEWAEGPDKPTPLEQEEQGIDLIDGVWKPDPAAFADFATAVAARYNGNFDDPLVVGEKLPRVRYYQLWNEGNLIRFLAPQYDAGGNPVAVGLYRELLNTGSQAIKKVNQTNKVVLAGTAPLDTLEPVRLGTSTFVRDLLCLKENLKPLASCPDPVKFDIFDHHAIAPRDPDNPGRADSVRLSDYHELTEMLRTAEKAGYVKPGGIKRPLWTTEIYWETNPPDTKTGVPPMRAAMWTQEGVKLLYEQGLDVVLYFFMRDLDYVGPGVIGNVQGGLLFDDHKPKPSYTAFAFPFTAERANKKKVELFARAPVPGKLKVQVQKKGKKKAKKKKRKGKRRKKGRKNRRGKTWKAVLKKNVAAGDVILKKVKLKKKKGAKYKLRAKLPGKTSLTYKLR